MVRAFELIFINICFNQSLACFDQNQVHNEGVEEIQRLQKCSYQVGAAYENLCFLTWNDMMDKNPQYEYTCIYKIGKKIHVIISIFKFKAQMSLLEAARRSNFIDQMMDVSHNGLECHLWSMFALYCCQNYET